MTPFWASQHPDSAPQASANTSAFLSNALVSARKGRANANIKTRENTSSNATPMAQGKRAYSKPGREPFATAFSTKSAQRAPAGGKYPALGFRAMDMAAENMTVVRIMVGVLPSQFAMATVQKHAVATPMHAFSPLSHIVLAHMILPSFAAATASAAKMRATAPKGGTQS